MDYELMLHYAAMLMGALAALVFVTNIVVEVVKNIFQKLPTNILAVIVALIVTALAAAVLLTYLQMGFVWYYIPLTMILGIFVAYAAMFGFDKFKEAFEKLKAFKE